MADIKVSALAAGTEIADADLFYYIDGGTSKKVTGLVLKDYVLDSVDISKNANGNPSYFIGTGAGAADLNGCGASIAIGENALNDATDADYVIAIGNEAGSKLTTGDQNILIGFGVGTNSLTTGGYNTIIGSGAGLNLSGSENTLIGASAGGSLTSQDGCVCIGYLAGYNNTTADLLFIDNSSTTTPLIWGSFASDILTIHGQLAVGTKTPEAGACLDLTSTTGALLVPRMTTAQRDALESTINGMIIYNTTTTAFNFYENGSWVTK